MKRITVHCRDCGASKTFRGTNVDEIIAAIDDADWHDQGETEDEEAVQGHCNGLCPKCWEGMDDDS